MIKQVITGHETDERDLWTRFDDTAAPSDRVYRTLAGYLVVSADADAPADAEAIGPVSDWYDD